MKSRLSSLLFISLFIFQISAQTGTVTQFSTIDALLNGLYDGQFSFGEVKKYGDFGIGTFDALDGEMVMLDGNIYQVTTKDGINNIDTAFTTPFSVVTFFKSDESFPVDSCGSIEELYELINSKLISGNLFYAIQITGEFSYIKTRSVPRQSKPYPALAEAAKHQSVFESENIYGTLVGFFSPAYIKGINVPGYHLHFLSKDKSFGGHVLNLRIKNAATQIDIIRNFGLRLPENNSFYKTDLTKDKSQELQSVEQEK